MDRAKIRSATFSDIIPVWGLMQQAHGRSTYSKFTLSEPLAKAILVQSVQRHGGTSAGSTFFAVAERNEQVEGFIVGLLAHLYLVVVELEGTDMYWYASPNADPTAARRLLRAMHRWAWKSPNVVSVRQSNTDAIVEPARSGALMRRQGMRETGRVYQMERQS